MDKVEGLVEVLLDKTARIDERDDAAMDLGEYDDNRGLEALLSVVLDPNEEPIIMDVCGESIAWIWVKRNYFDYDLYNKMNTIAKGAVYNYIAVTKPEWIEKYQLDKDDFFD